MALGIFPFHLDNPICWCTIVLSYNPFYFCKISSNVPIFISDFSNLSLLSFFLVNQNKALSILLIFSKNQLVVSLIFSVVFLFFSYYCVVFMYFEQQSFNWKYILHICSPLCPLPEIHQITSSEEGNFLILASFNLSIFPFMVSTPFQLHRTLAVPQ